MGQQSLFLKKVTREELNSLINKAAEEVEKGGLDVVIANVYDDLKRLNKERRAIEEKLDKILRKLMVTI